VKINGRKLSHAQLEAIRFQAVKAVQAGQSPTAEARELGLYTARVFVWLAAYRAGGWDALRARKASVEEEERFEGIFVLRTDTEFNPLEAMLCYKQLWTVELTFRTAKHLFATRPIFHKLDETIRGHVFCSFVALVLKKALEDRIAALDRTDSWPEIHRRS
jgi:Helix-turn-helix domain